VSSPYLPQSTPPEAKDIANHLAIAILSTLFCCLPLGIVSIVYAVKVNDLIALGAIDAAREASENAKKWAIWAAVVQLVGLGLYFSIFIIMIVIGAATN